MCLMCYICSVFVLVLSNQFQYLPIVKYYCIVLYHAMSCHVKPCHAVQYGINFSSPIVSYCIVAYHTVPRDNNYFIVCSIVLKHNHIVLYPIVLCYIKSVPMSSYHIVSCTTTYTQYHIILHQTISYRIISYCNLAIRHLGLL